MHRRDFLKITGTSLLACMTPTQLAFGANTRLKGYLRTNWRKDPFALGSYSYLARGSRQRDRRQLEKPVNNRLFFAGEAVHPDYNSTVHAAYESGQYAAARLIEADYKNIGIVGAGMAGLSAAHALSTQGVNVTIFEARDRIGGRIHTDTTLGLPLDLGASWIHGTDGNPLTELASKAGQRVLVTDDSAIVRGGDGRPIDEDDAPDWLTEVTEIQHNAGADARQINTLGYVFLDDYDGEEVIFQKGYGPVLAQLKGDYDIRLGQIVTAIDYDQNSASITTAKDSTKFDAVIVTLPLGVLKAGKVDFNPVLPRSKRRAINKLGMGTLDKVYLQFDKVFWDDETWIATPENGLPRGQFNQWLNLDKYLGVPVIMAFNGGTPALDLSSLPDNEIIERAQKTLQQAYQL